MIYQFKLDDNLQVKFDLNPCNGSVGIALIFFLFFF